MVLIAAGHPRPNQIFSKVLNSAIIPKQRFAIGFGLPSGKRVSSPFCRMNRLTPCSVSCSMIDRKSSWRGGYIHRSRPYLYAFCGTLAAKMNLVKSPIGSVSGRVTVPFDMQVSVPTVSPLCGPTLQNYRGKL